MLYEINLCPCSGHKTEVQTTSKTLKLNNLGVFLFLTDFNFGVSVFALFLVEKFDLRREFKFIKCLNYVKITLSLQNF